MPRISVVIPCFNEEKYVHKLLDCFSRQNLKPEEIIVADSDSEDGTLETVRKYSRKLPVKVIESAIRSPGGARNAGAAKAAGEYLIFIDADIIIPDNFIKNVNDYLEKDPVDFISPKYRSDGGHFADTLLFWVVNNALYLRMKILKRIFGIGGVMIIRRSLHEQVGGFDPNRQAHNDMDYLKKLKRQRPSFAYLDSLVVTHSSRRYQNQSMVQALFSLLKENTIFGVWFIQPALQKRGRGKRYGRH